MIMEVMAVDGSGTIFTQVENLYPSFSFSPHTRHVTHERPASAVCAVKLLLILRRPHTCCLPHKDRWEERQKESEREKEAV